MNTFNKHEYLTDLRDSLLEEFEGSKESKNELYDKMEEFIHYDLDDACMYYNECFDICKELRAYDFNDYGMDCNNICQLAYAALSEYITDELDLDELIEKILA